MPRLAGRRVKFKGKGGSGRSLTSLALITFLVVAGVFFLTTFKRFQVIDALNVADHSTSSEREGKQPATQPEEKPLRSSDLAEIWEGYRDVEYEHRDSTREDSEDSWKDTVEQTDNFQAEDDEVVEEGFQEDLNADESVSAEIEEKSPSLESVLSESSDIEKIVVDQEEEESLSQTLEEDEVPHNGIEELPRLDDALTDFGTEELDGDEPETLVTSELDDPLEAEGQHVLVDTAEEGRSSDKPAPAANNLDPETGLSHDFLDEIEVKGGIDDYLKNTQVDFEHLDHSKENGHHIEQAFSIAHWKEWQNTTKGVKEYYKLNVMFDDSDEEKQTWKKTMIRIDTPSKNHSKGRRRRGGGTNSRSSSTRGRNGGTNGQTIVDGNRKIVPVTLECDESVLKGLSRRERAKTGCYAHKSSSHNRKKATRAVST